jgi:hypothetical protein
VKLLWKRELSVKMSGLLAEMQLCLSCCFIEGLFEES